MSETTVLSLLLITGEPTEQTPSCVVQEVCAAENVTTLQDRSLLAPIEIAPPSTTSPTQDLRYLAAYVNRNCSWPLRKLLSAFSYLQRFLLTNEEDPLNHLLPSWTVGLQTPDCPFSLNACVLYRICRHHHLNLSADTSILEMQRAVHLLTEKEEILRYSACAALDKLNRSAIVELLLKQETLSSTSSCEYGSFPSQQVCHRALEDVYSHFHDLYTVQSRFVPLSPHGAIALAAILYRIDLSRCDFPGQEYRTLMLQKKENYFPHDRWMSYWYRKNPSLFDLNLTFNPLFSAEFYGEALLRSLTLLEGLSSPTLSFYEQLQENHLLNTFYLGEMPNISSTTSCIELNELAEINPGELLCYGPFAGPFTILTMTELTRLFTCNCNFSTPFRDQSNFSSSSINKLKNIARSLSGPLPGVCLSESLLDIRENLLEAIRKTEIFTSSGEEGGKRLLLAYSQGSSLQKIRLQSYLRKILDAGMYMRGWRGGTSPLPVIRADVPSDYLEQMALNVTAAIADFENTYADEMGELVASLPLVRYRGGEYQLSSCDSDGRTIRDRFCIIKEGEESMNISSCIRISSNWLCASACKYLTIIGIPAPFVIGDLREIQ